MLAREALAAACAAEAASRAAQRAHAAAQYVLAGLEAATTVHSDWEPQTVPDSALEYQAVVDLAQLPEEAARPILVPDAVSIPASPVPDQPRRSGKAAPVRTNARKRRSSTARTAIENLYDQVATPPVDEHPVDTPGVEIAEPIFANLIQFPREVVATRKMRPRRAEGPLAGEATDAQLSIFEVDPGSISTQPAIATAGASAEPAWMRPDWAEIELEEHPQENIVEEAVSPDLVRTTLELASLNRRLLALVVDGSLIAAAVVGIIALASPHIQTLPSTRTLEFVSAFTLLIFGAGYETLFFTLTSFTPGMWYAGIRLRTLEGHIPERRQRCARLLALPLSVLPFGLGLVWSLFDDNRLTWHDLLSRTYLQKR
jgi:uncharacterized RDD family membrane protein YckC